MTSEITFASFDKICRLCMQCASERNALFPLFLHHGNYGRYSKEFKESIPEIIFACIGLKVDPSDGLPLNICDVCSERLLTSNSFRHQCLQNSNFLQDIKIKHQCNDSDEYDSDDNTPLQTLITPELIIVDSIKDEKQFDGEELMDYTDSNEQYEYENLTIDTLPEIDSANSSKLSKPNINPETITKNTSTAESKQETIANETSTNNNMIKQTSDNENIDKNQSTASDQSTAPKRRYKYTKPPKQCTVCGLIVKRLRDHMKIHPEAMEFKCEQCARTYLTKAGLDRHVDVQHADDSEENESGVELYNKKGQKLLKKPVKKPHKWKVNIAKAKRNMGETYISKGGLLMPAKTLQEPCGIQCKIQCRTKITEEQREKLLKDYWNLGDITQQRHYIVQSMVQINPKYRNAKPGSRRSLNFAYYFSVNKGKIRVCKTFFLNTIHVSDMTVRTAIKKFVVDKGVVEGDGRGKHNKHRRKYDD